MNLNQKRAVQVLAHMKKTGQGFCYVPAMTGSAIAGFVSQEDMELVASGGEHE